MLVSIFEKDYDQAVQDGTHNHDDGSGTHNIHLPEKGMVAKRKIVKLILTLTTLYIFVKAGSRALWHGKWRGAEG